MQMPSPIGPSHVGIAKVHGPHGINAPHAPFRGQQTPLDLSTRIEP